MTARQVSRTPAHAEAVCDQCARLKEFGRPSGSDPIHCPKCHKTWTGTEAQHCVRCHTTFTSIAAADNHRYRKLPSGITEDRCIDVTVTAGWRESRTGVWTNAAEMTEEAKARFRKQ